MERINEPTPNGGIYAEIFYMNDSGEEVDKDKATQMIIKEFDENNTLIETTYASITPNEL
jgi:hypothetical protein